MKKEKCTRTGKVRYPTEVRAAEAMATIHKKGEERKRVPTRVYECDFCRGFHLTSSGLPGSRDANLRHEDKFKKFMENGSN